MLNKDVNMQTKNVFNGFIFTENLSLKKLDRVESVDVEYYSVEL